MQVLSSSLVAMTVGSQMSVLCHVASNLRTTLKNNVGSECLSYINALGNDPEHAEQLEFHGALLLGQIRGLWETDIHFRSFPWHAMVALDTRKVPELLDVMATTWDFVQAVIDPLSPTSPMGRAFYFTRFQPFRDLFTKAEPLV